MYTLFVLPLWGGLGATHGLPTDESGVRIPSVPPAGSATL